MKKNLLIIGYGYVGSATSELYGNISYSDL